MKSYLIPFTYPQETEAQNFQLEEFAIIGSSASCSHQVVSGQIAERHFRIEFRGGHHWVRDLRSGQQTFVNDSPVSEAPLAEGDLIKAGDFEWTFSKVLRNYKLELTSSNLAWSQELSRVAHAAGTDFPILVLGPSGAGKDILAQAIHRASLRVHGPYITVNCSALTESLVESELFGHIKGSFTGAINDRKGAFESARNGTLFLDEIGDLPLSMQAKLLRALENQEIRPVGADQTVKTNVRVIAATHQNLIEKIREGKFRADLYYRLNVVTIHHPALCERMEDFDGFLAQFSKEYRVKFTFEALSKLKSYPWPGNVRELKNFVARASAIYPGVKIDEPQLARLIDLNDHDSLSVNLNSETSSAVPMPIIREIEKQVIIKRLMANRGNQRRTAIDLNMPKSTLHDRLKTYQINPKEFRL